MFVFSIRILEQQSNLTLSTRNDDRNSLMYQIRQFTFINVPKFGHKSTLVNQRRIHMQQNENYPLKIECISLSIFFL